MALPSPTKTNHFESYPAIDPTLAGLSTKGKNVVITGGGSGLGVDIAIAFAKSGASNIALLSRSEKTLLETKAKIDAGYPGTKTWIFVADLPEKETVDKAIADVAAVVGKIDILVANAGYLHTVQGFMKSDLDDWYRTFDVNVKGNFNLIRAFVPHAAPGAAVISVSTVIHLPPIRGYMGYHASKLAEHKLFEYLHADYPDMFVLSVHPGRLDTAMNAPDKLVDSDIDLPFTNNELPANFIVWAVSPEAKFLNGKIVWAMWDVPELKAMASEIEGTDKFTLGLIGWP